MIANEDFSSSIYKTLRLALDLELYRRLELRNDEVGYTTTLVLWLMLTNSELPMLLLIIQLRIIFKRINCFLVLSIKWKRLDVQAIRDGSPSSMTAPKYT